MAVKVLKLSFIFHLILNLFYIKYKFIMFIDTIIRYSKKFPNTSST